MLISTGSLTRQSLAGKIIIVTGAGQGIGAEAARALLWLGARVIIAEINQKTGKSTADRLSAAFGAHNVRFIPTDVGDERSIARLAKETNAVFGSVDAVINNATLAPMGAVAALGSFQGRQAPSAALADWDTSYRVNLRGPVLLARAFLPAMLARNTGAFVCVSSYGIGFMGAYETMKAAQAELAGTLCSELEGSQINVFTIGPGAVPTATMQAAIPRLAGWHGKTTDAIYALFSAQVISVEAAGAGFAAALALAFANPGRYQGQEISSAQALGEAGILYENSGQDLPAVTLSDAEMQQAAELSARVLATLREQSDGWKERSVFERQWMNRSFNKTASMPVEPWLALLERITNAAQNGDRSGLAAAQAPLPGLAAFYANLAEMAKGYLKDPAEREKYVGVVKSWQADVEALARLLNAP